MQQLRTRMNSKILINILLGLLVAVILFHLLVIAKVISYKIAWGGRLQNDSEMYILEIISVIINLFLAMVLLMKGGYIELWFRQKVVNIILWIYSVLFILNTIGNLFSKTTFEKFFAVLTFILAVCILLILRTSSSIQIDEKDN